jgi:hypothetical protein
MSGTEMKNAVLIALVVLVILFVLYQYDPSLMGLLRSGEGFQDQMNGAKSNKQPLQSDLAKAHGLKKPGQMDANGPTSEKLAKNGSHVNAVPSGDPQSKGTLKNDLKNQTNGEGFADLGAYEGPAQFGSAEAPAGCYPRDQLTPSELLPKDMNSIWAEQNPMGPGSLKGKNFLSAGALIGVNTVGQSLRNANLQIRSEPPNPQVPISVFNQSTISPDISHRPLEIGA